MARTVSADVQKELYLPQTSYCFLTLAEINSDELASPIYLVNNNENILSNGNTYIKCQFEFSPPAEVDGTPQNASIALDGVDRSIIEIIQAINDPLTVTISVIEVTNPDTIEFGAWEFTLRNVSFNYAKVTGDLVFQTYLSDNTGTLKYNNINFPGLYG